MAEHKETDEERLERMVDAGIPRAGSLEKIIDTLQLLADRAFETIGGRDKVCLTPPENFFLAVHSSLLHMAQERTGKLDPEIIRTITNSLFLLGRISIEHPEVLEEVRATLASRWGTVDKDAIKRAVKPEPKSAETLVKAVAEALGAQGADVHIISSMADLEELLEKHLGGIDLPDMKGDPRDN